jgi:hypothetical protein
MRQLIVLSVCYCWQLDGSLVILLSQFAIAGKYDLFVELQVIQRTAYTRRRIQLTGLPAEPQALRAIPPQPRLSAA